MKRIKSAPANLALMTNNKKKEISNNKSIFNIPIINIPIVNKDSIIDANIKNKNVKNKNVKKNMYINNNNFSNFKNLKYYTSKFGNFISDIINDTNLLSLEESTLLSMILIYSSENIFKKDKLK